MVNVLSFVVSGAGIPVDSSSGAISHVSPSFSAYSSITSAAHLPQIHPPGLNDPSGCSSLYSAGLEHRCPPCQLLQPPTLLLSHLIIHRGCHDTSKPRYERPFFRARVDH